MRIVLQRVSQASVQVAGELCGSISLGYVTLVAFKESDDEATLRYMVEKLLNLRLFNDEQGKMNLSLLDVGGELLVISQFTLYGDARKGRRPSYSDSAPAEAAEKLYDDFLELLRKSDVKIAAGLFQEHMEVSLVNDGPVTILLDSEKSF